MLKLTRGRIALLEAHLCGSRSLAQTARSLGFGKDPKHKFKVYPLLRAYAQMQFDKNGSLTS